MTTSIPTGTHMNVSSTPPTLEAAQETKAKVLRLDQERKAIEAELKINVDILGSVGMQQPLVDAEGYPRSDIDILAVRTARNRVVYLRNDLRKKEEEMEQALFALHAFGPVLPGSSYNSRSNGNSGGGGNASSSNSSSSSHTNATQRRAFAVVQSVTVGSPSFDANLCVGDLIVEFGPLGVTSTSSSSGGGGGSGSGGETTAPGAVAVALPSLAEVGALVQRSKGQSLDVVVLRRSSTTTTTTTSSTTTTTNNNNIGAGGGEGSSSNNVVNNTNGSSSGGLIEVKLKLTPQAWAGPGLLGCHILPVN